MNTKQIKIIQINKRYHPWIGGVETVVKNIATFFAKQPNYSVTVLCCNTHTKTTTETTDTITIIRAGTIGQWLSLPISLAFIRQFKKINADILHFHLPNPLAVIAYLWHKPKGKVIVTWHSDIIRQKIALWVYKPFLTHFLHKYVDKIIVTSPNMKDHSPYLKNLSHKTCVIPLGIETKNTQNPPHDIRRKKIQATHPKFVLFVGRFVYYKGVMTLLEAIKDTPIQLIMIGDGPLKPKMTTYIKKHCPTQVTLYPPQPKDTLQAYFNCCDYFVLPSTHRSEAFGLVQLEAMINEKAVISTNLPTGVPYVNKHDQTGHIVPPNDIQALNTSMMTFWNNPDLCHTYGKQGKERVMNLFTLDSMCSQLNDVYQNTSTTG